MYYLYCIKHFKTVMRLEYPDYIKTIYNHDYKNHPNLKIYAKIIIFAVKENQ